MVRKTRKKKAIRKKVKNFLSTREGTLVNFTKLSPGKFAFVFVKRKGGKKFVGKGRFSTKTSLQKKFASMVKKK